LTSAPHPPHLRNAVRLSCGFLSIAPFFWFGALLGTRVALPSALQDTAAFQAIKAAGRQASTQTNPIIDPLEGFMLRYAVIFFIIAIIAAFFGFGGIASGATEIAKILFFIFIVIFLATLLLGVFRR
jgi:uncharacterized membrane protein YtjA (UPF0391 family)